MFDLVAPRYDAFTRLFSYGMDARWKRTVVSEVATRVGAGAHVLDLGCGTGDLAFGVAAAIPGARVRGVDASPRMIALARARLADVRAAGGRAERGLAIPEFVVGDLARLDAADGSLDAVTAGYAFRNAPDHRAALREAARVLTGGGVLVTLDFYRPESPLWRALFLGYLRAAGNAVGWWWHREPVAYGYIAPSVAAYVSAARFGADLDAAGFDVPRVRTWVLGGVAMHVAVRRR